MGGLLPPVCTGGGTGPNMQLTTGAASSAAAVTLPPVPLLVAACCCCCSMEPTSLACPFMLGSQNPIYLITHLYAPTCADLADGAPRQVQAPAGQGRLRGVRGPAADSQQLSLRLGWSCMKPFSEAVTRACRRLRSLPCR